MNRTFFGTAALILLIASFTGCSSVGAFNAANVTQVRLAEDNYDIVATGLTGTSSAAYVLGISYGGSRAGSVALFRVDGTGMLYKEALESLWEAYEKDHGPRAEKRVALVNVHYDSDALNLLLYTEIKVFIHADVVEFR